VPPGRRRPLHRIGDSGADVPDRDRPPFESPPIPDAASPRRWSSGCRKASPSFVSHHKGALHCKSPVFRLYDQEIRLLIARQALFFLRRVACYFAARGAFTGVAPLFVFSMPRFGVRFARGARYLFLR
jgi:hypothetical protein